MRLIKKWNQSAKWLTHPKVQEDNMIEQEICTEREEPDLHKVFLKHCLQ